MAVLPTVYGPPLFSELGPQWFIKRGVDIAGIPITRASIDVHEALDLGNWIITGTWSVVTTAKGGAARNNSTAAATLQRGTSTLGRVPFCTAGDPFYVAWVFKVGSGGMAAGRNHVLSHTAGSGQGFNIGGDGTNISTAFFGAYSFNGAVGAAVSTRPIDANWHYGELWHTAGGVYQFAIDGETPVTLSANLPVAGTALNIGVNSQPNGVAQDHQWALTVSVTGSEV